MADNTIEHLQQLTDGAQTIAGRVDADHGIAVAVHQPIQHAGGDASGVVGGMVGLQPGRHAPGQAHGIAKAGDHANLLGHQD